MDSINTERSYTEYEVTEPTTDFAIGFDNYSGEDKDAIHVTLDGVNLDGLSYTVVRKNAQTIEVTPAIESGVVRLQRETYIDQAFHTFTAGALFSPKSMDENFGQVRRSQQEVFDGFVYTTNHVNTTLSDYDARIVEVEDSQDSSNQRLATEIQARKQGDLDSRRYAEDILGMGNIWDGISTRSVIDVEAGLTQAAMNTEFTNEIDAQKAINEKTVRNYPTLASAVIDEKVTLGDIIRTTSYHDGWAAQTSPPKGGNTYLKVEGDTGVADGGAYIDCPDGTQLKGLFPDGTLSISQYGAKSDGVTDDITAINNAINNPLGLVPTVPVGVTCISDTIKLGERGKTLQGTSDVLFKWSESYLSCEIRWIGGIEPRKTMVLLGQNEVGAEPIIDSTANVISNTYLNGMNKVGFLMYGTYLTNDSLVQRVGGEGSTEYNFYFARGWYTSLRDIVSRECANNGIALGMPLIYADGTRIDWTTSSPLELNQCQTTNIRSIKSGSNFKTSDKAGVWKPKTHRFQGYGIGVGEGNGFRLSDFLSESSGGVNLLSWSKYSPSKVVEKGYLENTAVNSNLDIATLRPNMILDYSEQLAPALGHEYRDFFMNYASGGIITFVNSVINKVILSNLYQPRFLVDGDGEVGLGNRKDPHNWVRRINSYPELGGYNNIGRVQLIENLDVNTRYTWSVDVPYTDGFKMLQIRNKMDTFAPSGGIAIQLSDGTTAYRSFPDSLPKDEWVDALVLNSSAVSINNSGSLASTNTPLDFRVVTLGRTDNWV